MGWGRAGLLPPSRPPLRVAEQVASLDVACEGRVDFALLPNGELPEVEVDWAEGMRMLVDMWDEPRFSWSSDRFDVKPLDVVPKPIQRPHPPVHLAGWSTDHARAAGRAGLGYIDLSGVADAGLELARDAYTEGRGEAEPEELVCVHAFAVAADLEPGDEALERLRAWEEMGVDQAILRLGGGDPADAQARIRFLTDATSALH